VRATLGLMPELAKKAAAAIPDCKLVLIPDVAHVPHLEAPQRFQHTKEEMPSAAPSIIQRIQRVELLLPDRRRRPAHQRIP